MKWISLNLLITFDYMYLFNVRVYGILISDQKQVLLSDEEREGVLFTKFPGGGLEYGEGLIDALKREFMEECNTSIEVLKHVYTTDFFEKSAFNESQIISIYYLVRATGKLNFFFKERPFDFDVNCTLKQSFRWMPLAELQEEHVTFLTDKRAVQTLKQNGIY